MLHALLKLRDRIRRLGRSRFADEQIVQNQPERIDVGALVDVDAFGLLRRHVFDGSDDGPVDSGIDIRRRHFEVADDRVRPRHRLTGRSAGRSSDAEIHDHRLVVGVEHDVGRLQIAVDDAGFVRGDKA